MAPVKATLPYRSDGTCENTLTYQAQGQPPNLAYKCAASHSDGRRTTSEGSLTGGQYDAVSLKTYSSSGSTAKSILVRNGILTHVGEKTISVVTHDPSKVQIFLDNVRAKVENGTVQQVHALTLGTVPSKQRLVSEACLRPPKVLHFLGATSGESCRLWSEWEGWQYDVRGFQSSGEAVRHSSDAGWGTQEWRIQRTCESLAQDPSDVSVLLGDSATWGSRGASLARTPICI
jgi:hypothetical protein